MKHFRIELHTSDPAAYEAVLTLAEQIKRDVTRGLPGGTSGFGVYVAAYEEGNHFDFPMVGNEADRAEFDI